MTCLLHLSKNEQKVSCDRSPLNTSLMFKTRDTLRLNNCEWLEARKIEIFIRTSDISKRYLESVT